MTHGDHVFVSTPSSGTGTRDFPRQPPYWHHEFEPCEVCGKTERCEDIEGWVCATPSECGTHAGLALSPTAILVPSLDRPQNLRRTVRNIHEATPEPHFILFCVSDDESKRILDELGEWYLDDSDDNDRRYVTRMNKLLDHLEDAKTVFFGSDDVIHHPGWLSAALRVMAAEGVDMVIVNDLHNSAGTQSVAKVEYVRTKAVFDAPGLAFHPGYKHNFADNEMFFTANMHKAAAHARDAIVEHLHPLFGATNSLPWDKTYRDAQYGWDHDLALWRERRELIEQLKG